MTWADIERKREYQRAWIQKKRLLAKMEAQERVSTTRMSIPKEPIHDGKYRQLVSTTGIDSTAVPDAIYSTPIAPTAQVSPQLPPLTSTHRFGIRAVRKQPRTIDASVKADIRWKGGGRIKYASIELEHCTIEIYRSTVMLWSKRDIQGNDEERVASLRKVLTTACQARGIELEQEADWKTGMWSHTVMENEALNQVLTPLAKANAGDDRFHLFMDESHSGKVESAGSLNWDATKKLYDVLFVLPFENAKMMKEFSGSLSLYDANIKKHLDVLEKMNQTLDDIRNSIKKPKD